MNVSSVAAFVMATLLSLVPGYGRDPARVHTSSVTAMTSGVWWIGQQKAFPVLPPPPQVPAGGLWVSSTAAGTVAVSALRFTVPVTDRQPILSMPIARLTNPPNALAATGIDLALRMLACRATGAWTPPAPGKFGALSQAPAYDCGKGQVLGQLSLDNKFVVFDLSQFVTDSSRTVSVVFVPGSAPPPIPALPVPVPIALPQLLLPSTFDVSFKPVTPAAVEVLSADPVVDEPAADDAAVVDDAPVAFGPSPTVDFAPVAAPATRARPPAVRFGRQVGRQLGAVKAATDRSDRTIAAGAFVMLCMWAWYVANRNAAPIGARHGRPYRTLYDGALGAEPATARPAARNARVGKPPSLR
ncbi:MAG: hypothetical protein QOJ00_2306 [Actinomycetota bacterium]